jgi:hypothetical protein
MMRLANDIRNRPVAIQAICGASIVDSDNPGQRQRLQKIESLVDRLSALACFADATADLGDTPLVIDCSGITARRVL